MAAHQPHEWRCAAFLLRNFMSEAFDPLVQKPDAGLPTNKAIDIVNRARERVLTTTKQQPAVVLSGAFVATILIGLLLGYWMGRIEEASKRQRFLEQFIPELAKWVKQRGRRLAEPIREGIEATKSAVEDVSQSGLNLQRYIRPIVKKQKRRFSNLF
jgi:hypothetical protein